MPKIKVEPYLMKKGNRVAKAAIQFDDSDGILAGFHLVGFTICDDKEKGLFVLFPAATQKKIDDKETRPYFFLRPSGDEQITNLENLILDMYESMTNPRFNSPRVKA